LTRIFQACSDGVRYAYCAAPAHQNGGKPRPDPDGETYRFERDECHGWIIWKLHDGE